MFNRDSSICRTIQLIADTVPGVCVCACVRACVRACMRACVRMHVFVYVSVCV